MGFPVVVEDLDADGLLALAEEAETLARAAERRKLRYVAHWCVLNPALDDDPAVWSDAGPSAGGRRAGRWRRDSRCAAFAAEQLGPVLNISSYAATQLMSDVLDLQHRLPRIWARVDALEIPAFRARRIAQATSGLSKAAAAYVDAELPDRRQLRRAAIERAIAEAKALVDPETVPDAEEQARASWGVRISPGPPTVPALGRAPRGSTRRRHPRPDRLPRPRLDTPPSSRPPVTPTARGPQGQGPRRHRPDRTHWRARPARRHGKWRQDPALPPREPGRPRHPGAIGDAPRARRLRGPWPDQRLGRPPQGHDLPVLDLGRPTALDGHEPTSGCVSWSSSATGTASSPGATTDARSGDLDHIDPYVDRWTTADHRARPVQRTSRPLCRRHHRCKTAGHWRYRRRPDDTYEWHGPHGRSYLVNDTGTARLS